jgi:hypothetical protein
VISQIVQVSAVHDSADPYPVRLLAANPVELIFTEKTAIDRILMERRIGEFMGIHNYVAASQICHKGFCGFEFPRRRGRRGSGQGDGSLA